MNKIRTSLTVLSLAAYVVCVCGCNGGGPDPKVEAARLNSAQQYASYYNKVNGDYDQLSVGDKSAFVKLAGGEEAAKKAWDMMKSARSAPGGSGGKANLGGVRSPGT